MLTKPLSEHRVGYLRDELFPWLKNDRMLMKDFQLCNFFSYKDNHFST
jgi:hypothetical protein